MSDVYELHNLCTIKDEPTATIQTDGILVLNLKSVILGSNFIKDIHDNDNTTKCGNQMLQILSLQDIISNTVRIYFSYEYDCISTRQSTNEETISIVTWLQTLIASCNCQC